MSIATQILTDMNDARAQVMALCNFDDETMNQLQWDGAIECLEKVLQSDEHGIAELPKTHAFWMWWKEQWYRRDMQFINALKFDSFFTCYTCAMPGDNYRLMLPTQKDIREMYFRYHRMSMHNPLVNNQSMEVSFHCLIKELASKK